MEFIIILIWSFVTDYKNSVPISFNYLVVWILWVFSIHAHKLQGILTYTFPCPLIFSRLKSYFLKSFNVALENELIYVVNRLIKMSPPFQSCFLGDGVWVCSKHQLSSKLIMNYSWNCVIEINLKAHTRAFLVNYLEDATNHLVRLKIFVPQHDLYKHI